MAQNNILIVDDHLLFGQSLKILVNSFEDCEVMQVLSDGKELVHFFENEKTKPDLILLDIKMPNMDGVETMKWLQEHHPQQKVLAPSMEDDEETIIKMIHYGVKGYILKDIQPQQFKNAIEKVLNNEFYYSDSVSEKISGNSPGLSKIEQLKDRELNFLKLICSELTYKEVAAKMNVSPKTVDNYRESLFEKLEVKSRIGLVIYAIKHKVFYVK